jgi:hypothetical protein
VPRWVLDAIHDLIDRLRAVTEPTPTPPPRAPAAEPVPERATESPVLRRPERIARPRRRPSPLRSVPDPTDARPTVTEQPTE